MNTKTNNVPPRWYVLTKDGVATLCLDEEDALTEAERADAYYPNNGPHVVAQLAPIQPAMPADADPLQGAVNWLYDAIDVGVTTDEIQSRLLIGYNRATRLLDAARRRIEGE